MVALEKLAGVSAEKLFMAAKNRTLLDGLQNGNAVNRAASLIKRPNNIQALRLKSKPMAKKMPNNIKNSLGYRLGKAVKKFKVRPAVS